jgi:hypothetical protein
LIGWKHAQLEVSESSTLLPALDLGLRGQVADLVLNNLPQGNISVESLDAELRLTRQHPSEFSAAQQGSNAEGMVSEVGVDGRIGVKGFLVRQGAHDT